jgi:hypothetical protein
MLEERSMGGFLEFLVKITRLVGSRRGEAMNYPAQVFLPVAGACAGNNICSTYSEHSTVCDNSVRVFAMFPPGFSSTSILSGATGYLDHLVKEAV